jgi:hypothetical protein
MPPVNAFTVNDGQIWTDWPFAPYVVYNSQGVALEAANGRNRTPRPIRPGSFSSPRLVALNLKLSGYRGWRFSSFLKEGDIRAETREVVPYGSLTVKVP